MNEVKLNIEEIRQLFPVLNQKVNGKQLVYLDNAATSQKPSSVIEEVRRFYEHDNSNIHRGIHTLAERSTKNFEDCRKTAASFINTPDADQVVFTKGTTESINLVAHAYGGDQLKPGDEVIISEMEHHSNIVPWQMICNKTGAVLKVIEVDELGDLNLAHYRKLLSDKTKIVSVNHASNTLGTINPIKEIIDLAHDNGAVVVIDGAQAGAHLPIDVQALDVDFYALSAHKMYGPTGVGILYGKRELLENMSPYQGGGEMISNVTFKETTYNDIPHKFEAGTPNIAGVIAFQKAMEFIDKIGKEAIATHEKELLSYATERLERLEGLKIIGKAKHKVSVVSFSVERMHHFDIGQMLDATGIAVRTGHHCTQPLMDKYGIEGTARASFAVYNTKGEIDMLYDGLNRLIRFIK